MRSWMYLLLVAGTVLAVAAAAEAKTVSVSIAGTDSGFDPESIVVNPGDVISWKNDDTIPHGIAANTTGLPDFGSENGCTIAPGQWYNYTVPAGFTSFGTYIYESPCYRNQVTSMPQGNITVELANQAPVAEDLNISTPEDTPVTDTLNASDADAGDVLEFVIASNPPNGSVALNATSGEFTYTPDSNFFGLDTFTYTVTDNKSVSAPATVTINVTAVNDAPAAFSGGFTTIRDLSKTGFLSALDVEGDALVYASVANPDNGVLALNTSTGWYNYTPNPGFVGDDQFTFKVNDGALDSNVATMLIAVHLPDNQPPVANNSAFSTPEDTNLTDMVDAHDADNSGPLAYYLVNPPIAGTGTVSLNGTTGNFTYVPPLDYSGTTGFTFRVNDTRGFSNVATVTITVTPVNDAPVMNPVANITTDEDVFVVGGLSATDVDSSALTFEIVSNGNQGTAAMNAGSNTFTYTPDPNKNGQDSFQVRASDGDLHSAPVTVIINITPVNDAPVAMDLNWTMDEDAVLSNTLSGSDVDGDTLTYSIVSNVTQGTLVLTNATQGTFTYTPPADFNGVVNFSYLVSDGTVNSSMAMGVITVSDLNDVPVANFTHVIHLRGLRGQSVVFTDNSTDSDGTIKSWYWDFGDDSNSTLRHPVHVFGKPGNYTVKLTVTDNGNATSSMTVYINLLPAPGKEAPMAPLPLLAAALAAAAVVARRRFSGR